jgi:hypothetical protein
LVDKHNFTQGGLVGTGVDPRFTQRAHQISLAISPFDNTCEVDAVSPEAAMRGLRDKDVYNQRDVKWINYKNKSICINTYQVGSILHSYRYDLTQ